MIAFIAIFFTSALWPTLPHFSLSIIAIVFAIPCLFGRYANTYPNVSTILAGALLGFIWSNLSAGWYLYGQLSAAQLHQQVLVEANVASIIEDESETDQINFLLKVSQYGVERYRIYKPKILVSWFKPDFSLQQGDKVRLFIAIKDTSGKANPYTFNRQQWLASKNIVATGRVIVSPSNRILHACPSLRQTLVNRLFDLDLFHKAWIAALAMGYRNQLSQQDWQLLQSTGTAHLFSISGMHLALFALYAVWIGKPLLGGLYAAFNVHNRSMVWANRCLVVLACFVYAWIAGMAVPVIRALITVIVLSVFSIAGSNWPSRMIFTVLVFIFCLLFPYSILGLSFWFSFLAVLLILLFIWRFPSSDLSSWKAKMWLMIKLQCFLSVATLPIVLYAFGSISLSAVAANLILVPFVSLILLPANLFMLLLLTLHVQIDWYFTFVDFLMQMVLVVLHYFHAKLPSYPVELVISLPSVLLIMVALLIMSLPRLLAKKRIMAGTAILLLIALTHANRSDEDKIVFQVFDVGHGNASLLFAKDFSALFDTGAGKPNQFSLFDQIIFKYLQANNITQLTHLFISHFDQDHAGGVYAARRAIPIDNFHAPSNTCVKGSEWRHTYLRQKQNMTISIQALWPRQITNGETNNQSCVLYIQTPFANLLLPGDIEKQAEQALLASGRLDGLSVDILIAPHHGSRSSSSQAFVEKIRPKYVLITTAKNNQWEHPHPDVVARYRSVGAELVHIGEQGAVTFDLTKPQIKVTSYRKHLYNRWYFKS
ncbi:DNA internalization-related competence protein ComEC/Rec2 [Agaribacter flavus]|uniref:DNA internalization-related competence protein ComEC/Rec2 n=1 Tax=Agaribacter flavus TaxID=1902781 RepID=A0ABV7FJ08_9ALTE